MCNPLRREISFVLGRTYLPPSRALSIFALSQLQQQQAQCVRVNRDHDPENAIAFSLGTTHLVKPIGFVKT